MRAAAAYKLSHCSAPLDSSLPFLIRCLSDPDAATRQHIVSLLGTIVPPRREGVLAMAGALSDTRSEISEVACGALIPLGRYARVALPMLLVTLEHPDPDFRCRAVKILGAMGEPRRDLAAALCDALKDPSEEVREEAARALRLLGPGVRTDAEAALLVCLRDGQQRVRIAAASTLVRLGNRSEETALVLGFEFLDPSGWIGKRSPTANRSEAALSLAAMGKKALPALPLILLAAQGVTDELMYPLKEVLMAMGPVSRKAIPILRDKLLNRAYSPAFTSAAAEILACLGGEGQNVLREALARKDNALTEIVFVGLYRAGPGARRMAPDILRRVRDARGGWNPTAINALLEVKPPGQRRL